MNRLLNFIRSCAVEEDGAQVIEYALIIAVVSIALVIALRPLSDNNYFASFISRLANCLTSTNCT
jgi:pilus assembly protein Flp/PilA